MSTHHIGCCCLPDVPGGDCDDSCRFATSYSLSDIGGSWHYERRFDLKNEDCFCFGGATRAVQMGYSVDVTFSQESTVTLTRCGSGSDCRYEARGELTITASVALEEGSYCCLNSNKTIADSDYIRTANNVPFCLTLRCSTGDGVGCARTISGDAFWFIILEICDFPVAMSHEFLIEDNTAGCNTELTNPAGIACGGARFVKVAKLKDPAAIFSNEMADDAYGLSANRCVNPPIGTDVEGIEACIPCLAARSPFGNFALYQIGEWSEQDIPEPCSLSCGASPFASPSQAFGQTPLQGACSSTVLPSAGPCYGVTDVWTGATAYGVCAAICEWEGIQSGGWTLEIG